MRALARTIGSRQPRLEHGVERVAEGRAQAAALQRVDAARGQAAGRGDLAAHGDRVVVAPAQQLGGAGERLHDEFGALRGGDAAAHARVDLRLGDERDVRRRARHQAHGDVDERVVEHDERAELGEQRADGRVELVVGAARGIGGLHDGALAHLDGQRRDEAVDRLAGIGLAQRLQRRGGEDRRDGLRVRRDFARDVLQLRGLVAEHDEIGAPRHLGVVGQRLAADLLGQRSGALGQRVGAQQRPSPPARERASHVAAPISPIL